MSNLTDLELAADELHRLAKMTLDTGEAQSVEEALNIFRGYRMQIVVGPEVSGSAVLQAALLTAINSGARTFLGGLTVVGATGTLVVAMPGVSTVQDAAALLGGEATTAIDPDLPTLAIGSVDAASLEPLALQVTFSNWCGGVVPASSALHLSGVGTFTPAGVLAGALGVTEIFQRVRGKTPMAGRRAVGLDLWDLGRNWLSGGDAAPVDRLPSSVWIVGMGNLGQAFLWTLGLLPYGAEPLRLVLQDTDIIAMSNLSTSILTTRALLGRKKTRAMAEWAEARGFQAAIVERDFAADFQIGRREPAVALIGVDNALARQSIDQVGFQRIIEAGLGRGTSDFLGIDLHCFPGSRRAMDVWPEAGPSDPDITLPAYRAMLEKSGDRCGTVRLAGRSIGASFVGVIAGVLAITELLRMGLGARGYEFVSCHLRDLKDLVAVASDEKLINPGTVASSP